MKIIVASDSHGSNEILNVVHDQHPDADMFLHCGDLCEDPGYFPDWTFVEGNNDFWGAFAPKRIIPVGKHRIYMVHSHRCSYFHREENLVRLAEGYGCDIVCFGHTHRSFMGKLKGIYLLNPGSICMPRDGNPPSYAILRVTDKAVSAKIIFLE